MAKRLLSWWPEHQPPTVVLLDIRMPLMDGIEAAQHLQLLTHHST